MNHTDTMKLALEALEPRPGMPNPEYESLTQCAITALREALAEQPASKPWVGLMDEQIDAAIKAWFENDIVAGRQPFAKRMRAAFAAAYGIKENT